MKELTTQTFSLLPTTFEQAERYAAMIANSSFAPAQFKGKPHDILIAIQMGQEVGLQPMQALQNIAVINGRPSIWGDAMLAIVMNHPKFEYIKEDFADNKTYLQAICTIKRKDMPEHTARFSLDDAKRAGLLNKQGPWSQYTTRMLQMRARGFALRDVFPDALKGLISREEAQDYPSKSQEVYVQYQPEYQNFDVEELQEHAEISKKPTASKEMIDELKHLLVEANISDEKIAEGLRNAGVDSLVELPEEKVRAWSERLIELMMIKKNMDNIVDVKLNKMAERARTLNNNIDNKGE